MGDSLSVCCFPLLRAAAQAPQDLLVEGVRPPQSLEAREMPTWEEVCRPLGDVLPHIPALASRSNHPLSFGFPEQLFTLVYFHVEEYTSARALLEDLQDPMQAPPLGLPAHGVARSTFFDAIHTRGLPQMLSVFERLSRKATKALGMKHDDLGDLSAMDGTLIDATLSMAWADYTKTTHKAKAHLCFDLNLGIPRAIHLTQGNAPERPLADQTLSPGQTQVMDRGYQDHARFDAWQEEGTFFVCRIRCNTQRTLLKALPIPPGSNIVFHGEVYLGDEQHRTQHSVRLVGIRTKRQILWIVTNRKDLTALQIAFIYRLRWEIEKFFAWWKRHLNVYHLIARSPYGLMMQLLAGLITYLLLVIYFYQRYVERPSVSRLRQLRRDIRRERAGQSVPIDRFDTGLILLLATTHRWELRGRNTLTIAIFIAIF